MFNPSSQDVRNFFFNIYAKGIKQEQLTPLEKLAFSIVLEHPEYHEILKNKEKYLDYNWTPDMGETNPFLHLSMHLSILEQLSIDQPVGLKKLYNELCDKTKDGHMALHELIDCLGEMIWQAQRHNTSFDPNIYLGCIKRKLSKE